MYVYGMERGIDQRLGHNVNPPHCQFFSLWANACVMHAFTYTNRKGKCIKV